MLEEDAMNLWLTVVLSFACYIPVVLFAGAIPMVGMLMIPKPAPMSGQY